MSAALCRMSRSGDVAGVRKAFSRTSAPGPRGSRSDGKASAVNALHRGRNALHCAVIRGHTPVVRCLVEELGADINTRTAIFGRTALHLAAQHGRTDLAAYLVVHGANVDAKDWGGETPYTLAAKKNHVGAIVAAASSMLKENESSGGNAAGVIDAILVIENDMSRPVQHNRRRSFGSAAAAAAGAAGAGAGAAPESKAPMAPPRDWHTRSTNRAGTHARRSAGQRRRTLNDISNSSISARRGKKTSRSITGYGDFRLRGIEALRSKHRRSLAQRRASLAAQYRERMSKLPLILLRDIPLLKIIHRQILAGVGGWWG